MTLKQLNDFENTVRIVQLHDAIKELKLLDNVPPHVLGLLFNMIEVIKGDSDD